MAHIKEPRGVDFIIKSDPLTKEEKIAISEYIRNYKLNESNDSGRRAKRGKKRKSIA